MLRFGLLAMFLGVLLGGCSGDSPSQPQNTTENEAAPSPNPDEVADTTPSDPAATEQTEPPTPKREFRPIQLGGGTSTDNTPSATGDPNALASTESIEDVFNALQPLNILIGGWDTTTRTQGAGKASWRIAPETARTQPTLEMTTEDHPYFQSAKLTYLPSRQVFRMLATDRDGKQRTYEGQYTKKPELNPGDDGKLQRTYELELAEIGNEDARKLVGVRFNQQRNNRMLMVVLRRVGQRMLVQDTVANQRQNTSFAISDTDYGERECIVSQGLGTSTVSFMGRTYYVCCSGCQAAFNDNPEFWIAQAKERKSKSDN
ncbi:hypothetical protein [Thalassoroseus pseudoceratinae]|uniref:hypothetical protein n=1 Tax=Thalassoroseus pseudoceratinae TaxID=2713176 RepID=UPI00141E6896|nr:hypothetical protein [Thalassoroseus pseudoceratinae]